MVSRTPVRYDEELLKSALGRVIDSGQFVNGPEGKRFEAEVCRQLGVAYTIGVNSGTSALLLSYKALGAKKILTTPFTFSATAMAAIFSGMEVVFCDIDPDTYCMDMKDAERVLGEHQDIDVVVPVHIFGVGADMGALADLKKRYGFKVVSDCAQAYGTYVDGALAGAHPCVDLGCFSLYPTKNLSAAGDGGFITTNDLKLHEKLIRWRDNGRFDGTPVLGSGGNFRISEFQAAIAHDLLLKFQEQQAYRNIIGEYYLEQLKPLESEGVIRLPIQNEPDKNLNTFHLFSVQLLEHDKDRVIRELAERGIGSTPAYGFLITDLPMDNLNGTPYCRADFPVARRITNTTIAIPISQYLTWDEAEQVVSALKEVLA